jgi:ferritin
MVHLEVKENLVKAIPQWTLTALKGFEAHFTVQWCERRKKKKKIATFIIKEKVKVPIEVREAQELIQEAIVKE